MKLWQKIFLLTLALVILVVNSTSLVLLSTNHSSAIEREQKAALSQHNYLVAELTNMIKYEELIQRMFPLTDEETLRVAEGVIERRRGDTTMRASLFVDGKPVDSGFGEPLEAELALLSRPNFSSVIIEEGGRSYLLIITATDLNNRIYQLVSSTDITSTYELFRDGLGQALFVGIVSALIIAGLLVLLARGLLTPLRELGKTTNQVASGNLDTRAKVTGHDEVALVARDFNTMVDAIEHNVAKLEELAESRRVFIGNLAHEMKTPLTSILGFADILRVKRSVSDEDRINYANVIVSETKRLRTLSGKLMELLTLGNLIINPEKVEIHELFGELSAALEPIMDNHELTLSVELPTDKAYISVDRELIKSLLLNLIDNSIKASMPNSKVYLSASRVNGDLTLKVIDEGVGIPEEQIPLLTEPFYSLDKARTRKHGGAGLGLALCSEIAQVHDSKLQITSKPGVGTTVSVTLKEVDDHGR